jgi:hypothetical protein
MSRVMTTPNFFVDTTAAMQSKVARLGRTTANTSVKEVDSSGLTSAQIDQMVFSNGSTSSTNAQPYDGLVVHDPVNNLLLVRQSGSWHKTAPLTSIP